LKFQDKEELSWKEFLKANLKSDMVMTKIRVTQIKSIIDRPAIQKATMRSLGFKKMNQTVEIDATDCNLGMINKVKHLVKTETV